MLIKDIVISARRILGDTDKERWSDERMLDIANGGLRDINKFAGAYRSEHFAELSQFRNRYPLPLDLLKVTSVVYEGVEVALRNKNSGSNGLYATKDQVNIGVLELMNLPEIEAREPRFVQGPTGDLIPQPINDLWANDVWNNAGFWRDSQLWGRHYFDTEGGLGVVSNPLLDPLGVTAGTAVEAGLYDDLPHTAFGLLSDVYLTGAPIVTTVPSTGDAFGVLTNLDTSLTNSGESRGSIGTLLNAPYRIAGRYGTVVSVLKSSEYVHTRYRALPQEITSLEVALPLSTTWIEPMINWIVGTALQDDNDANNTARAALFLGRYSRELEKEIAISSEDYSNGSKKYETKYTGGIK